MYFCVKFQYISYLYVTYCYKTCPQVNHVDKKMDQVLFLLNTLLKARSINIESREDEV